MNTCLLSRGCPKQATIKRIRTQRDVRMTDKIAVLVGRGMGGGMIVNFLFRDTYRATRPTFPFRGNVGKIFQSLMFSRKRWQKSSKDPNSRNVYFFHCFVSLYGQTSYTEYRMESGLNEKSEQREEVLTAQYTEKMIRLRTEEDWIEKKM